MGANNRRLSAKEAEERRVKGIRLLKNGMSQSEIANTLGVSRQAVYGWERSFGEGGIDSLKAIPRPGRPLKAPKDAINRLTDILLKGPIAYGFQTDLWTSERVCEVFKEKFGIQYNPAHMTRILHRCGLSWQKPARQAAQKDPKVSARWKRTTLPRLKKNSANGTPL